MEYIGWIAVCVTFISIYLYNRKHNHAPDAQIMGCILWSLYAVYYSLNQVVFMNIVLIIVTAINYKSYKVKK